MQEHRYAVIVDGTPDEVWQLFWYRGPRRKDSSGVSIEILHPGDAVGEGLIRHCTFRVPRYLMSGGVGQSWEWLTEVHPIESWRYDAIGKPLWSRATGHTRLEDLGSARTRVHFHETYETFNPLMRRVGLERYVHRRLSRDNDTILAALNGGLAWHRRRQAKAEQASQAPPQG